MTTVHVPAVRPGRARLLRRLRPTSLRGRVVVTVLALLSVILVVLFAGVDLALSARLHADARTRLSDRVALAQQLDGTLSPQQLVDRLRGDGVTAQLCLLDGARTTDRASGGAGTSPGCVTAATAPAPGALPAPRLPPLPPARPRAPAPRAADVRTAGSVLFVTTVLDGDQRLTLSTDTTQISTALSRLVLLEVVGGSAALLAAGLLLSRLARLALRPLDDMTRLARSTAAGDRGQRLRVEGRDSELARTAAAFDAMLDELEQSAATAVAAEARMREVLGDASHELRTPLAGLSASAESLLRDDPDRAGREQLAVGMVRETRRAGRLVDDLLTMARLDSAQQGAGALALRLEPVDLVTLVRQEVDRLAHLAPGLRVQVHADVAPSGVVGDPVRLAQVVSNLLDNARHVTPPAGRVDVTVRSGKGVAEVEVCDTGPGVPPADRERVFGRFTRLDASRSRHSGGAGLGLPVARGLARAHGGDLVCTGSPDGPGACFRLTLPARAPDRPRADHRSGG